MIMKSFIFDLDGTLIDSYKGITNSILNILKKENINESFDSIYEYIIRTSVVDYLNYVSEKYNIDNDSLKEDYKNERVNSINDYKLMPNCSNLIEELYKRKDNLFIFTHKGESTYKVLEDNNLSKYFKCVIDSSSPNFKRKPDPYSLSYIIDKYNLDINNTFYVGDRKIDVESAKNANIKSILYRSSSVNIKCDFDYEIYNLIEILDIK